MNSKEPTEHARLRLTIRGENPDITLQRAWEEGFSVKVTGDEGAETRMHSPSGSILYARENTIVTVKKAQYEDWYSADIRHCSSCREKYDPPSQGLTCPYCGHENSIRPNGGYEK